MTSRLIHVEEGMAFTGSGAEHVGAAVTEDFDGVLPAPLRGAEGSVETVRVLLITLVRHLARHGPVHQPAEG